MLENLRQLFDKAAEFCREQSEFLMIGGAVLIILIILIAVIRSSNKKDSETDTDFDENLYLEQLLAAKTKKEAVSEKETAEPGTQGTDQSHDSVPEPAEHRQDEAESKTPIGMEAPVSMEAPIYKGLKKSVIFPDELIDEIAKASSKNLQEVEIKIQSAELRIKYAGSKDKEELLEEVKHFKGEEEQEKEQTTTEAEQAFEEGEELLKEKIDLEEIAEGRERRTGKFGPENFNTARSGRVYTEDELERQIRD